MTSYGHWHHRLEQCSFGNLVNLNIILGYELSMVKVYNIHNRLVDVLLSDSCIYIYLN